MTVSGRISVWTSILFVWMGGVGGAQTISTVAGGGLIGLGDGGPATLATLMNPTGVCVDDAGDLYIADTGNSRIRKVSMRRGIITTVAGGGNPAAISGPAAIGDGGPATRARLPRPWTLFIDDTGSLYIVSSGLIRKVDPGGTISTVAGSSGVSYSGASAGDGGPATIARIQPTDVFVDGSGNLYISGANRIRKVDAKTGIINTVIGAGGGGFMGDGGPATDASLWYPGSLTGDGSGNLYIADTNNRRIRKVDAAGFITTVAGNGETGYSGDGGPATDASLRLVPGLGDAAGPSGIFVDGSGNLYIADTGNHRVRKVDGETGIITTVAGNGKAWFSGDGGPATDASLWEPRGVSADGVGNLYISDTVNHRIRKVAAVLRIALLADPDTIAADGVSASVIQARIENDDGVLISRDNTTAVAFELVAGAGSLSASMRAARGGIAKTRLTSRTPGTVTVRASAPGIEGAAVSVEAVPTTASPKVVRASDFDGNGKVEFADFLTFARHFGAKPEDPGYDAKFDLDGDREVGFGDFLLFAWSFGRSVAG